MKGFILGTIIVFAATSAHAENYKKVHENLSSKNYDFELDYPSLLKDSVPAYTKINSQVRQSLIANSCDAKEAEGSQIGYNDNENLDVVTINDDYVSFEGSSDSFCGGAHPNAFIYYATFNSKTGDVVDMNKEFPAQADWDNSDKMQSYQQDLAEIIYESLPKLTDPSNEDSCFKGMSKKDAIDQLVSFYPSVAGLDAGRNVILSIEPPHVAEACQLSVSVPFSKVEKYVTPNSILKSWLK